MNEQDFDPPRKMSGIFRMRVRDSAREVPLVEPVQNIPTPDFKAHLLELEAILRGISAFSNKRYRVQQEDPEDFALYAEIVRSGLDEAQKQIASYKSDTKSPSALSTRTEHLLDRLNTVISDHIQVGHAMMATSPFMPAFFASWTQTLERELSQIKELRLSDPLAELAPGNDVQSREALRQDPTIHYLSSLLRDNTTRILQYLSACERCAKDLPNPLVSYLPLAAATSCIKELSSYLKAHISNALVRDYDTELLATNSSLLSSGTEALQIHAYNFIRTRCLVESHTVSLASNFFYTLDNRVPLAMESLDNAEFVVAIERACEALSTIAGSALQELRQLLHLSDARDTIAMKQRPAELMQEDVWMLLHVLIAFQDKVRVMSGEHPDSWHLTTYQQTAADFLRHFRTLGYRLLEETHFEQRLEFIVVLNRIVQAENCTLELLQEMAAQCEFFTLHLEELLNGFEREGGTKLNTNKTALSRMRSVIEHRERLGVA